MIKNIIRFTAANTLALTLTIGCSVAVQEQATAQTEPVKASSAATSTSTSTATATATATIDARTIEAGTIIGTVVWKGKARTPRPLPVETDSHCVELRAGKPLLDEILVLGEGQTMANVIVHITSNLPKINHPVPTQPVIMSQKGCQYEPHVFAMQAGQKLQIENPDGINHNVHLLPEKNKEMNRAMANASAKFIYTAEKAEDPFTIKCDVHAWMKAYCAVFDHPYFAVTKLDGTFKIEGLPPGTYDIQTWHEITALGTRKGTVTIEEGKGAQIDFTYERPTR